MPSINVKVEVHAGDRTLFFGRVELSRRFGSQLGAFFFIIYNFAFPETVFFNDVLSFGCQPDLSNPPSLGQALALPLSFD